MNKNAFLLTALSALGACRAEPPSVAQHLGDVVRVVDGDSLYLSSLETQIRLFGVDAPERNEPGFAASKAHLTKFALGEGVLCREVERDRYGRIVARCFLSDNREINRLMIEEPNTQEYCRYSKNFYGHCNR